ncbi:hypothetical protein CCR91_16230 [Thiorhodovibrio winogradskyi]|nr:hypothetical protein [Thiorhodovibrio winogradskyi]
MRATGQGGSCAAGARSTRRWGVALGVMLALLVAGCGNQDDDASEPAEELTWDDLLPADWQPEKLLEDFNVEDVADEDPRAAELMDKLQALWQQAPVVPELDGRRVRLPGFVVPVDLQAEKINAFLLVPYFGACIHVPPPPANQTVYVQTREGRPYVGALFDTVWVEGTMQVEQFDSDLGNAGYRIEQARVTPYEIKE